MQLNVIKFSVSTTDDQINDDQLEVICEKISDIFDQAEASIKAELAAFPQLTLTVS